MLAKHSINILLSRFTTVYKTLLYVIILLAVLAAIAVGLVYPILSPVISEMQHVDLIHDLGKAFSSIFGGDAHAQSMAFHALKVDFDSIIELFIEGSANVWGAVAVISVMVLIYKFMLSISHYTVSDIANHFMASNSRFGYTSNMIANIRKSVKYSALHVLLTTIYDIVYIGIMAGIAYVAYKVSWILLLPAAYILLTVGLALKRSALSYWLPGMIVDDKSALDALKENFKSAFNKRNFGYNFGMYCMIYFLGIAGVIIIGLATFGVGIIVVPTVLFIYGNICDMVIYYNYRDMKYYIDKDRVINSKNQINDDYC